MPDYAQPNVTASIEFRDSARDLQEIAALPAQKQLSCSAQTKSPERKR
jgi:hypothetical protein